MQRRLLLKFSLLVTQPALLDTSARAATSAATFAAWSSASDEEVPMAPFSANAPGHARPAGWSAFRPAPKAASTRYTLVDDEGVTVIEARADDSMSGLIHRTDIDLSRTPLLRWRWKIRHAIAVADLDRKSGDDYAARLYVLFAVPHDELSFGLRAELAIARAIYGTDVPAAAINYVWDNSHAVDTMLPNAYTARAMMVVTDSGNTRAGHWVSQTRDVAADFRRAFPDLARHGLPRVGAVAIATDTANTHGRATAWYGDIAFLAAVDGGAS
ncbi:DUF3047 domain-containing protein [Thiomonas sp.]